MKRESNKRTKQKTEIKGRKNKKQEKGAKRKNELEIPKAMAMKITMVGLWRRVFW